DHLKAARLTSGGRRLSKQPACCPQAGVAETATTCGWERHPMRRAIPAEHRRIGPVECAAEGDLAAGKLGASEADRATRELGSAEADRAAGKTRRQRNRRGHQRTWCLRSWRRRQRTWHP